MISPSRVAALHEASLQARLQHPFIHGDIREQPVVVDVIEAILDVALQNHGLTPRVASDSR